MLFRVSTFKGVAAISAACWIGLIVTPAIADGDDPFTFAQGLYARKFYRLAADKYEEYLKNSPQGEQAPKAEFMLGECFYQMKEWEKASITYTNFLVHDADAADRPAAEIHAGDALFNQNKFPEAASAFHRAMQDLHDPKLQAYASYWYAESLYQQKQYADALKGYSLVVEKFPESDVASYALFSKGAAQADLGQNTAAAETFAAYIQRYPKASTLNEAAVRLGDALYASQSWAKAAGAYQEGIDRGAGGDLLLAAQDGLAWADLKQQKYAEAAPLFAKVAAAKPDEKIGQEARLEEAVCELKTGSQEQALQTLRDATKDAGTAIAADAGYLLAKSLLDMKKYAESMTAFHAFLDANPGDPRSGFAYAGLGDAAAALDRYPDAADAYAHAAKLVTDPKLKLGVLTGLLWADQKLGKSEDAATVRAQIKQEFPGSKIAVGSQLADADKAFQAKQYEQALAAYRQFAEQQPNDPEAVRARYRAALSLLHLGQRKEAAAALLGLVKDHPDYSLTPAGLLLVADEDFKQQSYDDALPLYTTILKSYRQSDAAPWALYGRASIEALKNNLDPAYTDFASLAHDFPKHDDAAEAAFRLGWIRDKQDKKDEASEAYQKALTDFPNSAFTAETLYRLGIDLDSQKQYGPAATAWNRLLKDDPKSPFAAAALDAEGWSLVQQKKTADAIPLFSRLTTDYADSPEAAEGAEELAELKLYSGDSDGAAKLLDDFIAKYPTSPLMDRALYARALVEYKQYQFGPAGDHFQKMAAAYPKSELRGDALFWGAESYRKASRPKDALPIYETLLAPGAGGDHVAAAAMGAGESAQALGQYDAALDYYRRAAALDSATYGAQASCYTGECLLKQQKDPEALEAFLKVIVLHPDDTDIADEAQFGAGQVFEDQKDWSKASEAYTKLAGGSGPWAARAKERLDAVKLKQ